MDIRNDLHTPGTGNEQSYHGHVIQLTEGNHPDAHTGTSDSSLFSAFSPRNPSERYHVEGRPTEILVGTTGRLSYTIIMFDLGRCFDMKEACVTEQIWKVDGAASK